MRVLIQRVAGASVLVGQQVSGKINRGYLVFLGVGQNDTYEDAVHMCNKMLHLRIFPDGDGKINHSLLDVGGDLLVVSQFTLYANCTRGNRPGFQDAATPSLAQERYEQFVDLCRRDVAHVATGVFGEHMDVSLVNDGPFTVMLTTSSEVI